VHKAASASETHAAEAAREALARGNAVDAVVTGVLVAAAESPSVLLGPLQMLIGGAGAGLIAIDGRVRQPGRGAPRPRGFVAGEPVPDAARVGAAALPAAVATALASHGTRSMQSASSPAVEWARARSPERAVFLRSLARRGAPILADDGVAGELTAIAGRGSQGLLTQEDLAEVRPELVRCTERSLDPSGVLWVPWNAAGTRDGGTTHVVAAADGRGLVAVASYQVAADGLPIPALGLVAPLTATPVLRGKPRVPAGEPCAAAAPIALRASKGTIDLALGIALAAEGEAVLASLLDAIASEVTFATAFATVKQGRPVGLSATRAAATVL
jgi:gamma-glutamyltranspeptidase/glutathione hydrolase